MNRHLYHILALIPLLAALTACTGDVYLADNSTSPNGKTPIELSVGGVDATQESALTRAVITDGTGKTLHALPKGSSIYMLMKADDLTQGTSNVAKCTRTIGFAQDQSPESDVSDVSFTASQEGNVFIRYWDDVYARKSALSIAAVCTPGYGPKKAGSQNVDNKTWKIGGRDASFQSKDWIDIDQSDLPTIIWPVGNTTVVGVTDQSGKNPDFITYQDLCFSNNIGDNTSQSKGDTRIKFNDGTKHFESGNLIFYHALSKLSFNIKKGEGFNDSEFNFETNTNIKLSNFNNGGTFNISTGEFEGTLTKTDINKIFQRTLTSAETTAGIKFGLDALVIPGTDLSASGAATTNAVTFVLAGNEYKLTMAQLYAAFTNDQKTNYFDSGKLKAGVHYVFTFTVSKTQIGGLSAQIVPWEKVEASNINPSNAQITLQLEDRGSDISNDVNVYRSAETASTITTDITTESGKGYVWDKGYGDANLYDYDNATSKLQTSWYWPDNQTFYHFRAVAPTSLEKKTDNNKDYVELSALENTSSNSTPSYTDVTWGAPFKDIDPSAKLSYSTSKGFDATDAHQIHPAIGTTESTIKLLMFHMMSDVTIKVQSVTGEGAVSLGDGSNGNCTTIKFEKIYKSGKVNLGNGLVEGVYESGQSSKGDYSFTAHPAPNGGTISWENYGAIPQDLGGATPSDATDDVILVITTPDHNEYRVSMKDVKASVVTETNIKNPYNKVGGTGADKDKYIINAWYPSFKYEYTFKLSKKKIEDITATILNWETIEASDEVQIK